MANRKQTGPKGLCAYFVESKESDGSTSVADEVTFLVKKCIVDKIFSKSSDEIAMCRSDSDLTSGVEFVASDWDGLRKGLEVLEEKRSSENGISNPLESLDDVVNELIAQSKEDVYEDKKIIYFANLSSYILGDKEVTKLAEKLRINDVFISIILPDKADRSEIQQQNSKLIRNVFVQDVYEDVSIITTMQKARVQILNTQTKQSKRPSAWNILLEVTPEIVINVGGYSCTRKNAISEMKRALIKETEGSRVTDSARVSAQSADESNPLPSSSNNSSIPSNGSTEKTVVVEPAKEVLGKEIIYKENDGTKISVDDIGKGYYFGDKLIPYNDLENEGSYQSGAKCLKLLAFCPKERIGSAFHTGDGITLFYPKKDDAVSEVKFKALMKAMTNTDRIAIVRRIYQKNSRVTIGTLIPDDDRQCLVFTELCFADDVSVPQFPVLIKPEELEDEGDEMNVEVSEKEALIDELIRVKTVDNFNPSEGPSDPGVKNLREAITKKIITDRPLDEEIKKIDNIDIFFQSLFASDEDELYENLRNSFPLKENEKENERFAGQNIFKKRSADDMPEADTEKRVKIEDSSLQENEANVEMEMENELDDLLDEL